MHDPRTWLRGGLLSALVLAVCVTIPVLAFIYFRSAHEAGSIQPPAPGIEMAIDERAEKHLALEMNGVRGFAVWSSNRSGQHDIYMLSLPQRRLERLTTHAHSEYFPRIAPDGQAIVFCRSRRQWLSQRNDALWDTYLLDLASRKEKRVAEYANVPTWSEDNRTVYFQRNSIHVVAHELDTGRETVLFQSGQRGVPVGVGLQGPDMRESDGTMAVTFRGGRGPRIIALCPAAGGYREMGGASFCQLAWSRDERFLYAVGRVGRMKNAIYRIDPLSANAFMWLDLPGEYGHEYFPRQSNDGRYLVCGASAGGHEHDTADYEIFLWKIGSAPQAAMRLTYHSSNDCWPDVFIYPDAAVQIQ